MHEAVSIDLDHTSSTIAADLSFKKCWDRIKTRSTQHERISFYADTIAGTSHRPDVIRALAADRGVSNRQARKWLDDEGAKPKYEFDFFAELMDHFDDDWRAIALAFDDYVRGKVFYGVRK